MAQSIDLKLLDKRTAERYIAMGLLDEKEWEHMRSHPVKGYEIASQIDMLKPTMPCIRNHH